MITSIQEAEDIKTKILQFIGNHQHVFMLRIVTGNFIEVFDPSRRPWVDMNGSTTERIIEVVNLCPTEALAWKWNDESKNDSSRK